MLYWLQQCISDVLGACSLFLRITTKFVWFHILSKHVICYLCFQQYYPNAFSRYSLLFLSKIRNYLIYLKLHRIHIKFELRGPFSEATYIALDTHTSICKFHMNSEIVLFFPLAIMHTFSWTLLSLR